jgi:hypothetical protein
MWNEAVGGGTKNGGNMRAETLVGMRRAPASEDLLCGVHGVLMVARTSQGHL